jgi:microcin C transport system substrate-binding protein
MNRRSLLTSAVLVYAARKLPLPDWISPALAEDKPANWRHGMSTFGDLKYAAGFKKFDYVNAQAPKGGSAWQIALGTYDSFNSVVAGIKGTPAAGLDQIYDTLFVQSLDEPTSFYGLIAESVSYPDDYSKAIFRLRPEAKWHDGKPVTTDDVIFSYESYKKLNPQYAANFRLVSKVEKTGEHEITFTFSKAGNRDLPQTIGQLTILPKHWWEGTDKDGKKRKIGETTLEPPLSSGAYRIKDFSAGRYVVYERVKDYWGKDLNVNIGSANFDELRYEYFRDATVAIESFKTRHIDWREENSAKSWATAYDFPAVHEKKVILEEFPIRNFGIMQAFVFNTRREKFNDARVRLAFNYVFNFEQMNKQIFFGQYKRIESYFQGTDLACSGLPTGKELELLQSVKNEVPPELFKKPFSNPVNGTAAQVRDNLRHAVRLLREAGYVVKNQQLVNKKTGEPFTVEMMANAPAFERAYLFYKPSLERLGMTVTVRVVDEAQYENRVRGWDFDVITFGWGESLTPGGELRGYFGSQSADQKGSFNVIGVKNPAVDAMIDKIVVAKTRPDLVAACRALDRILLWNNYVVPQWTYGKVRTARWDRFGRPEHMPEYGMAAFPALWWFDAVKSAKVGPRQ